MSSLSYCFSASYRPVSNRWPALAQAWLPVLAFCALFAIESSAAFGSDRTSGPLHHLLHPVLGGGADRGWTLTHHLIRKFGHFTGYGLFSLVCFRACRLTQREFAPGVAPGFGPGLGRAMRNGLLSHAVGVALAMLVASADELHQCFLPNRTGCVADVLLDTAGAVALQLTLAAILGMRAGRRGTMARLTPVECPLAA